MGEYNEDYYKFNQPEPEIDSVYEQVRADDLITFKDDDDRLIEVIKAIKELTAICNNILSRLQVLEENQNVHLNPTP